MAEEHLITREAFRELLIMMQNPDANEETITRAMEFVDQYLEDPDMSTIRERARTLSDQLRTVFERDSLQM